MKFKWLKCPHIIHLDLIWMNYDQKKGWDTNREFDSQPQIPLEQGSNVLLIEACNTPLERSF